MRQTEFDPTRRDPSRRQVLRGGAATAAGLGAAMALTACGDAGAEQPAAAPSSGGNPITVAKAEVPEGAGIILTGYVVTQPTAGEFRGFSQTCPHQGCLVSMIRDGNIVCACHTSLFAISNGEHVSGPAKRGLTEVLVVDDGDNLLVG
jgi:Rieske Fe-S protein